jgi:hypothetical protein
MVMRQWEEPLLSSAQQAPSGSAPRLCLREIQKGHIQREESSVTHLQPPKPIVCFSYRLTYEFSMALPTQLV